MGVWEGCEDDLVYLANLFYARSGETETCDRGLVVFVEESQY